MYSLRQIRSELVSVRLGAADTSVWSILATLEDRANQAIVGAVRTYEFYIRDIYSSAILQNTAQALPANINVTHVVIMDKDTGRRVDATDYRQWPTPYTNLFQIFAPPYSPSNPVVEVEYTQRLVPPPGDTYLLNAISSTQLGVTVTGSMPLATWPSSGWLEFSVDNTLGREVVRYSATSPTGFGIAQRQVEGLNVSWPAGTRVSPVIPLKDPEVAVLLASAEAQMYQYWLSNRASYAQLAAYLRDQASISDLAGLVRQCEDRAERLWRKLKTPPAPAQARR